VIGAHLAGVKTIVLPKDNEKDLEEIPKYILKDLEFRFVEGMDEVLEIAFARPWKTKEVEETGGHYAPQFLVAHDSSTAGVHHRLPN
jgi:predicted ATP-dependent protease